MKVYISGKIGEDEISVATQRKFLDAVEVLAAEGHEAFNPCGDKWVNHLKEQYAHDNELLKRPIITGQLPCFYAYCLIYDMMELSLTDAICMLPDWESSPGAKAELAFAQAIGLKVFKLTKDGELK